MKIEKPNRIKHSFVQTLNASPERVFPLLCPTMEREWAPGWDPVKVISSSGVAEEGCIFITPTEPQDAIWIITHHDAEEFTLEMYKVTPGHTVGKIEIALSSDGDHGTKAKVSYEYTSLSAEGDLFIEAFTPAYYNQFMEEWERALNHYLKTGEKIAG